MKLTFSKMYTIIRACIALSRANIKITNAQAQTNATKFSSRDSRRVLMRLSSESWISVATNLSTIYKKHGAIILLRVDIITDRGIYSVSKPNLTCGLTTALLRRGLIFIITTDVTETAPHRPFGSTVKTHRDRKWDAPWWVGRVVMADNECPPAVVTLAAVVSRWGSRAEVPSPLPGWSKPFWSTASLPAGISLQQQERRQRLLRLKSSPGSVNVYTSIPSKSPSLSFSLLWSMSTLYNCTF